MRDRETSHAEWEQPGQDVPHYPNPSPPDEPNVTKNREEISSYFERRQRRLKVVATTETPRGQIIDWVPIESQLVEGAVAEPPPSPTPKRAKKRRWEDAHGVPELEYFDCERGPSGTVPVLRKKLSALSFRRPLAQYLAKGPPERRYPLPPTSGRGGHWHASAHQRTGCFGGSGEFSCFSPYVDPNEEQFSLLQIWIANHDLAATQTVEAGWQVYPDLLGDFAPHLFVYYTTNGYAHDDDNQGGYNQDVDGWIQHDNVIFPGSTFAPLSVIDGEQRKISLRYQLFNGNWWLGCQDRWVGYYPARLFMGNQSTFSTLGDHADEIAFWGEVSTRSGLQSGTDMGSGRFPAEGWRRAAYFHDLLVQSDRGGGMTDFAGWDSRDVKALYDIDLQIGQSSNWGSYAFVGGPGAV
jgi:hypothetical protein